MRKAPSTVTRNVLRAMTAVSAKHPLATFAGSFVLIASGCTPPRLPALTLPAFVNIEIRGAVIGPGKYDGAVWDGYGTLNLDSQAALTRALAMVNPYAAVASVLSNPASAAIARPEPFGHVRVTVDGTTTHELDLPQSERDTVTPLWRNARLAHVRLVPDTRLGIVLMTATSLRTMRWTPLPSRLQTSRQPSASARCTTCWSLRRPIDKSCSSPSRSSQ